MDLKLKTEQFFKQYPLQRLKKSQLIITPGEAITHVSLLTEGNVKMYFVSESGQQINLHIFRPGSFFPIMLSLKDFANKYYFEAETDITIYKAPTEEVIAFLKQEPEVLFDLTSRFAMAINGLLTRIETTTTQSSYQRILDLLNYLDSKHNLNFTHDELANWLGLSRETVSRMLEKMQYDGLVELKNKQIILKKL